MQGMRLARATVLAAAISVLLAPDAGAALRPANRCLSLVFAGAPHSPVGPFFFKPTALGRYLLGDRDGKALAETTAHGTERATAPAPAAEWATGDRALRATGSRRFLALENG